MPPSSIDDATLVQDILAARDAQRDTAPAIIPAVDRWLLRAEGHRASVGTQLARWCVTARQRFDPLLQQESAGCLQLVANTYGIALEPWLDDLNTVREFKLLMPGNTPRKSSPNSNHWGIHNYRELLRSEELDVPKLQRYGDGTEDTFRTAGGVITYFYSPFRAAFLRAILASWFSGNDALTRIADTAQTLRSPFLRSTTPSSRTVLGFFLCEAVDDELFQRSIVHTRRTTPEGREETYALRSPTGTRYLEFLQQKVVPLSPDSAHDEAADAELRSYAQDLARLDYRAARRDDAWVVTVTRRASVPTGQQANLAMFELYPFDAIIVCGFTPLNATEPVTTLPTESQHRVDQAARDFHNGLAPFIVVSGGAVYPMGSPIAEATLMRDGLVNHRDSALRVPANRIILDHRARHTPTNVRNPARILRGRGVYGDVVVIAGDDSDDTFNPFEQDEYMAGETPFVSYEGRCMDELGYPPFLLLVRPTRYAELIAEWLEKAEREHRSPSSRVARYLYHQDRIEQHLGDQMHLVVATSPEVSRRFNVRDALDP